MWPLFDSPAFAPFIVSGLVLLILLIVEMLGFFFGGLSGFLDNLVPDSLLEVDVDTDVDIDFNSDISLGLKALDWLYVGRIPTMILLILFIGSFCITGILLQQVSLLTLGHYLSPWLASLDAVVISIPVLKISAALLYPILPKDETTAVSGKSLVGRPANILIGHATIGSPAQAKTVDKHGQTHYVMVEPDPKYIHDKTASLSVSDPSHLSLPNVSEFNKIYAEDTLIITQKVGDRYLVKKV